MKEKWKIITSPALIGGLFSVSLTGCEWFGEAKVEPVIKKGPAMTSLESAIDVDRITALLPPDNSYANRTTSIAIKVSGTCISGSAAVKVTVANTETKIILACDEQSGTFGTTLDLSSLPDGNVQIEFSFLKAVNSTNPMYVLERRMFKDTESLPAFQVPASLSESSSGMIDIAAVEGAASYKTTFTPTGGGTAIGPIETFVSSVPVTGLVVGTTYAVAVTAFDAAGNDTQASNTGTFIKTGPPNPSGLSATAVSGSQINLAWTSGGGSSAGFVVAYQSGASAPASCAAGTILPASGKITGTTYSVTGLSATTQYSFRVCAVNNDTTPSASSGVTASATTLQAPPPNPTGPTATAISTTRIDLAWTSGGGSTADYRISYQTGATAPATCAAGTTISESSITGTSHSVTGLTAGTQYSFRICAINGNPTPDTSSGVTATATTFQAPPPNPTGPTATGVSNARIDLEWTSGGGSTTDYRIAYDAAATPPADCSAGTPIPESSINGTSHSVTGLIGGTQYSFRICAINGNATPDVSGGVTVSGWTIPSNPTSPTATAQSATQINLSWTAGSGATADYRISYQTGATAPATCAAGTTISESSITDTSHSVTGLTVGTQYSFRICAINGNATPDASSGVTATATTLQAAPPNPTGATATPVTSTRVDLTWASGGGSTVDYRIAYRSGLTPPVDCASGDTNISEGSITGTSHSVTGLSADTDYSFRICAINGNATPDVSNGVTVSAKPNSDPPDPTSPSATVDSSSQITLSWTSGGGTTTDYRISYQTGATAPATCDAGTQILESSISGVSHAVSGLSASTEYSFRICAINGNTPAAVSGGVTVTATTFQAAPPNPTGATATPVTSTRVDLTWASGGGSTVGYRITYLDSTEPPVNCSSGTTILESSITGTSHSVTGLSADTDYSFRICAINGNATPDVSNGVTVSAKPNSDPPDPTNQSATADSISQITLSWTSGGGATTDYRISYQTGATAPATCDAGTKILESSISGVSHAVTGLSASTQYAFRICAINGNTPAAESAGVTVSATTSAGSGSVNYRIYVPYFEGTGPFLAKWEVTSSSDASGIGSYVRLEDDLSNKPDAQSNMSIAIDPSGVVSVVYPYSWGAASNCASGGIKGKLYNSALTLQTTHTPDASYSLGICGVDVAYDAAVSKFKYFYATHARSLGGNDDGVNTVRVATEGGTSSEAMAGNTQGYEQVAARITSGGRYEVNAVGKENNAQPLKIHHFRENDATPIVFTECSPGTSLSKLHMVEVAKGEDTILGGRCDTGLLLADNKTRTTANTNYLKERVISSPVENSNADFTDEAIIDDNDTPRYFKVRTTTNTVLYCQSPTCSAPFTVYNGPSNTEIQSVRAVKASDGAVFVVIAIKEKDSTGGKKNKLAIVKRTAATTFSTASLLNLDAVNVDIQIGRRIAIEGAPGNSNWTNKYTLFASSLDHYGDMTTTADSSTILTPNNLCKGYALGARLPRAESAVAVIAMGGTIAANVGTVDKDVYTNAPTPTLFKYGINFLSDSSGPSFSSYYDETGTAWTGNEQVWLGGTSSSASTFKCIDPGTGNKWSSRADTVDGAYDTVGQSTNDTWINPGMQAARMCDQSAKVLCLIK